MSQAPPESIDELTVTRRGAAPVRIEPDSFLLTLASFGIQSSSLPVGRYRIGIPAGWRIEPAGRFTWRVEPGPVDPDRWQTFTLEALSPALPGAALRWSRSVPVRLDLRTEFDPSRHAFPLANRASVLGDIDPQFDLFRETYRPMPGWWQRLLFKGLYSEVVFIRSEGPDRGGLCSGMARWAIGRFLGDEPDPTTQDGALKRIIVLHGRQLTDRVLLATAVWFFRGSPGAAYRAVRDDILRSGTTDRALDINVPKPWRRDILSALVGEGHTVVPYRISQPDPGKAFVDVYDPNRPPDDEGEQPNTIELDLYRDRYAYRNRISMEQDNVGMIAVRQAAYSRRGTTVLTLLGSAIVLVVLAGRKRLAQTN